MLELERVWLVKEIPADLIQYDFAKINQGYLNFSPSGRLRRRRNFKYSGDGKHALKSVRFELTQKKELQRGDKKRREENNIFISEKAYNALRPLVVRSLKKVRHLIPLSGGLMAELDVFGNGLTGLVWVEVEFPTDELMESFSPPDWFGREVTNEKWASSSWVAGRTFADVQQYLTHK